MNKYLNKGNYLRAQCSDGKDCAVVRVTSDTQIISHIPYLPNIVTSASKHSVFIKFFTKFCGAIGICIVGLATNYQKPEK